MKKEGSRAKNYNKRYYKLKLCVESKTEGRNESARNER